MPRQDPIPCTHRAITHILTKSTTALSTCKPGDKAYKGSLRHKDPLQCDHGATGRMLVNNYHLEGMALPDPLDKAEW